MAIPKITADEGLNTGTTTRLYIAEVGADGADTTVWTEAMRMPLNRDVDFTPTGNIESVPLFGEIYDRAVKTGVGGTLSFTTLGKASNPNVQRVLDAAAAVGPAARVRFLVVNPDMRAYVGIAVVEAAAPMYDSRNVFGYEVSSTVDGQYVGFNATSGDIGAAGTTP